MDGRNKRKKEIAMRYCIVCGHEIIRGTTSKEKRINIPQYLKTKFCSLKCKGVWQSENKKGNNNPNFRGGKSKCSGCGKELSQRFKNTKYCRNCWNYTIRGKGHWNWRGGKTDINILERHLIEAKTWRLSVFERDDFTCQICGDNKGHNLNAHHIKPWAKYPELRTDLNNGITLCKECHKFIHKK